MRIVMASYPLARAGPDATGGAEQIAWILTRELRVRGHEVRLLTPDIPHGVLDDAARRQAQGSMRQALADADADIVHLRGLDFAAYAPSRGGVLVTLHLPYEMHPPGTLAPAAGRHFNCVSLSQRAGMPAWLRDVPVIPNGIDIAPAPVSRRDFALMLARVCPEKGFHLAADACRMAGVALFAAGELYPYPAHLEYARSLAIRLRGPRTGARKRRLLSAARCLLVPSLVPETSSLAAREALACGTPVIGFARGALPEIIRHGCNGFLVNSTAEMARAIQDAGALSVAPFTAFSVARMAENYLALYRSLAACASN